MHRLDRTGWTRKGDFNDRYPRQPRDVVFYYQTTDKLIPPIKSLYIKSLINVFETVSSFSLAFKVSPLYFSNLPTAVEQLFPGAVFRPFSAYAGGCEISIFCQRDQNRQFDLALIEKLKQLKNSDMHFKAQLTNDLLAEIQNLLDFVNGKCDRAQHIIPTATATARNNKHLHSNPLAKYVSDIRIADKPLTCEMRKNIHRHLADGADPDQEDSAGFNVLTLLCWLKESDERDVAIKLMLNYQVNFKKIDSYSAGVSPLEYVVAYEQTQLFSLMTASESRVERPLPQEAHMLSADIVAAANEIQTAFRFPQGTLHSTFKSIGDLTDKEKQAVYRLYRKVFEGEAAIDASFAPQKNKFINLIFRENGQISGFVTYLLNFTEHKLHCCIDLALADNEVGNFGIMPAHIYGFPFSLQQLFPQLIIWVIFLAVNKDAIRHLAGPYFPKYGSARQKDEIEDILINEFGFQLNLVYENPSICYAVEKNPVVVKKLSQNTRPDLTEELYEAYRDNNGSVDLSEIKKRGVVIGIPMSFEFGAHLQEMLARRKLNFMRTANALSSALAKTRIFSNQYMLPKPQYYHDWPLFKRGEKIPAAPELLTALELQPQQKTGFAANL